jgi:hypothetical protein
MATKVSKPYGLLILGCAPASLILILLSYLLVFAWLPEIERNQFLAERRVQEPGLDVLLTTLQNAVSEDMLIGFTEPRHVFPGRYRPYCLAGRASLLYGTDRTQESVTLDIEQTLSEMGWQRETLPQELERDGWLLSSFRSLVEGSWVDIYAANPLVAEQFETIPDKEFKSLYTITMGYMHPC